MAGQTQGQDDAQPGDAEVVVIRYRGESAKEELFAVPVELIRTYKLGTTIAGRVRREALKFNKRFLEDSAHWAAVGTAFGTWEPAAAVNLAALSSISRAAANPGPGRSIRCFKSWIPPGPPPKPPR